MSAKIQTQKKQVHYKINKPEWVGCRLDAYLAGLSEIPSRSFAQKLISAGAVSINGKAVKASYLLVLNDEIIIEFPEAVKSYMMPEAIDLSIIYEDDHLLVINKPRGLVVHPGSGNKTGTLTQALLHHCGHLSVIGGVERPGIVHRLDKGTSGLMVVAKNDKSHIALAEQFKNHTIIKKYLALLQGKITPLSQKIENKIARHEKNRQKYCVQATRGRSAISFYQVIKQNSLASLVEVQIYTGRTHQIRVHMSHKGCPLWGDITYGAKRLGSKWSEEIRNRVASIQEPLLHAAYLEFLHPITQKKMSFKVAPPQIFKEAQKVLAL